jgi:hypothetical protein
VVENLKHDERTVVNISRSRKRQRQRERERECSTYRLHGRTSGRMRLDEELRRCLSKTSDLSFDSLKKAQTIVGLSATNYRQQKHKCHLRVPCQLRLFHVEANLCLHSAARYLTKAQDTR